MRKPNFFSQRVRAPRIRKGIREKVENVYLELGDLNISSRSEYEIQPELIKKIKKQRFSDESLQLLANNMFNSMGLLNHKVKVFLHIDHFLKRTVEENTDKTSCPVSGLFRTDLGGNPEIHITQKAGHGINEVAAIMAHECVKYFLSLHKTRFYDIQGSCFLADVASIYLGFSHVLIKGYKLRKRTLFDKPEELTRFLEDGYASYHELVYIHKYIRKLISRDKHFLAAENKRMGKVGDYDVKATALLSEVEKMKLLFEKNNLDIKKMLVVIKESAVTSMTEDKILKKVKEDQLKSFPSEILELYNEAKKIKGVDFADYKRLKSRADLLYKRLHTWVKMLKMYKEESEREEDAMFL